MLTAAVAVTGAVAAWFITRWAGRGRPYPASLAALFDNRLAQRLSGVQTLLDRASIRPGMRVLDAGCGPGRLTISLAQRVGNTGEVVALDVQPEMLERVSRNAQRSGVRNVTTVLAPLESNSGFLQERETFDRILLVTVLGEIPDGPGSLRALHIALKAGGILSVTEMIIDPDYVPRGRLLRLAEHAGFKAREQFGSRFAFTMNFGKLDVTEAGADKADNASKNATE